MKAVRLSIAGRVQGVGFRYWTVQAARALGLTGWVRNEPDGSVTAHAEGPRQALDTLIQRCHSGPSSAAVDGVTVEDVPLETYRDFAQI